MHQRERIKQQIQYEAHFIRAYVGMCREIVVIFNTNQESAFCTGMRGYVP